MKSERTRVRRHPERGEYEREAIHAILDEAPFCHIGFVDGDQPFVIPTIHARLDDTLYLHGAPGSRMLRLLSRGEPVCVTATILDGLVLARSVFNHSMNYRSAVVLGRGRLVEDTDEKLKALNAIVEHVMADRSREARAPNRRELMATSVVALPLEECSAKVRTGPPKDDEEDLQLPVWAGILPMRLVAGEPELDPASPDGDLELPAYIRNYMKARR